MPDSSAGAVSMESRPADKEKRYWLSRLSGELVKSFFPYDHIRTQEQVPGKAEQNGKQYLEARVPGDLFKKLNRLTNNSDRNLYVILVAALTVLLGRYTGNKDIVFVVPIYKQRMEGEFINTVLPLRNRLEETRAVKELLVQAKQTLAEANQNANYPMEHLLHHLGLPVSEPGDFPLTETAILLQNIQQRKYLDGINLNMVFSFLRTDSGLEGVVEYNPQLYRAETVERIWAHLMLLLAESIKDVNRRLNDIVLLTDREKQLLLEFNDTQREYPRDKTIHRMFAEQAARTPDSIAIHMTHRTSGTCMTYDQLNKASNQLAHLLRSKGPAPGAVVGIMVEPAVEMISAILAVLKAGGTYLPLAPDYPGDRLEYMLTDSSARILLSQQHLLDSFNFFAGEIININNPDTYQGTAGTTHLESVTGPEDNVYAIYTSGTTGKPKGVLVKHGNLVNYVHWFSREAGLTVNDRAILTSSFIFDLGYTAIYPAILNGCELHMVQRETYLDAEAFLDYLEMHQVTYIKVTPSLFNVMVNSADFTPVKFRHLRLVVCGGEPINITDIREVHTLCPHLRVMNHYGPSETTIGSVAQMIDFEQFDRYAESPTIGRAIDNMAVFILDPDLNPMPIGMAGEICLAGAGVGSGYLNNPELTAERFVRFHRSYISYRTGDLGRWLENGPLAGGTYNIEFLGRIDHQVKIRGFRIELGEIESRLLKHREIKDAAVLALPDGMGNSFLCAYIVAWSMEHRAWSTELREYLSQNLPDYMVPGYFVPLEELPLTPNGKLDRRALPLPDTASGRDYMAPRDEIEEKLVDIWAEVLPVEGAVGITDNFFEMSGNSLSAVIMISKIHKELNVKVPLTEIFETPTIMGLSAFIEKSPEYVERFTVIEPVELKEYYPISSAQKRMFTLHRMDEEGTAYNMPQFIPLGEAFDIEKMEETFNKLIHRHESLRTSFRMVDDQPVQVIHKEVEFSIEHYERDRIHFFVRPFDLPRAPLLRVGLAEMESGHHLLLTDMHHIMSDGVSRLLLIGDFMSLHQGEELPPLRIQYKDFSEWQNSQKEKERMRKEQAFWTGQFEDEIPVLNLSIDYARPALQSFEGSSLRFGIPDDYSVRLRTIALEENVSLYMVMLALYNILLSKLSGQEDIVVGTPVAGRRHADLDKIMGMFVNTLALRNYPKREKTFRNFLTDLRNRTIQAFENQTYPFEDLVENVAAARDMSRNPLFDVLFDLRNVYGERNTGEEPQPGERERGIGIEQDHEEYENQYEAGIAKFDLSLGVVVAEQLSASFEYSTKLFKRETIERFIRFLNRIAGAVTENPDIPLLEIDILSEQEKDRILYEFNDTNVEYPLGKPIHLLFEEQARQTPDSIVLHRSYRTHRTYITYKELNRRSDQLSHVLRAKGVVPGTQDSIVGLMMERSLEMIFGILGILKAGGAYLPIDPAYPEDRIQYMLEDSGAKILLTAQDLSSSPATRNPQPATRSGNLAYVIYTSGTTGRPKGVMIEHRSILSTVRWFIDRYGLGPGDHVLQTANIAFDVSAEEIFASLLSGAALYVTEKETLLDKEALVSYIKRHIITIAQFVPVTLKEFITDTAKVDCLKVVICGGDYLGESLKEAVLSKGYNLHNHYGPTETAVDALVSRCDQSKVVIGKPISNAQAYVVDRDMALQPVGVAGELCVGGAGLARGYLNDIEKTHEKFVPISRKIKSIPETYVEKILSMFHRNSIYLTGDMVRWFENGTLEFLGRMDRQVKVRGYRIELEEIENLLLRHDNVKEAVVLDRGDNGGDKYLCAYIVAGNIAHGAWRSEDLRGFLSRTLPDYMVPAYFMEVEKIPLTPNGKVDRKALPEPEAAGREGTYTAPRDPVETKLVELWSDVLGSDAIGIDDNFFQLGGHSLKATILVSKVYKALNVKLPLTEVFRTPTIRELARYINKAVKHRYLAIQPAEKKEYYSLSSAQKRLYVLQQMNPDSTAYNMTRVIYLFEPPDVERLEESFLRLIKRHEVLRTSFTRAADQPVQKIHDNVAFKIEYFDDSFTPGLVRPFDLSCPPLLRVGLIKRAENRHILIVDMHHIISDGISHIILERDFSTLYEGERAALPPLRLQYKDYAQWQNSEQTGRLVKQQETYWLKTFQGDIPVLNLPLDSPRPAAWNFEGDMIQVEANVDQTAALKKLALEEGVTMYMLVLAMYNILLSKLSGQENIIVGTVVSGRNHPDLEHAIGAFVNLLPMRNYPAGKKTFQAFLREVKENALTAFENQNYPFETLVEKIGKNKDMSRHPLLDVGFTYQGVDAVDSDNMDSMDRLDKGPPEPPQGEALQGFKKPARLDMNLEVFETNRRLTFEIVYCAKLFKRETILQFAGYFGRILSAVLHDPAETLENITIISEQQKETIRSEIQQARDRLEVEIEF